MAACEKHIAAYRFDLSAHGDSAGRTEHCTHEKLVRDVKTVIEHFSRYNNVILLGHGLGGVLAALATDQHNIIMIGTPAHLRYPKATTDPATIMVRKGSVSVPYTFQKKFFEEKIDVLGAVAALSNPVLIVHGTEDKEVPAADAQELFTRALEKELLLVGGADHSFAKTEHLEAAIAAVMDWIDRM
jgi:alpha-beta hydrolase superfamily lysophospholipase